MQEREIQTDVENQDVPAIGFGLLRWSLIVLAMVLLVFRVDRLWGTLSQDSLEKVRWSDRPNVETEYQCNSALPCVLWVGEDGSPGQKGWDDNSDGETDNLSELGAVHSDDRLLTHTDPEYTSALDDSRTRKMFVGGYRACEPQESQRRWVRFLDDEGNPRSWAVYR